MKKFTLIELLVIVAILAILISLLLPALSKSREITKTALCLSNISQINKALNVYTSSNSGFLPRAANRNHDAWPSMIDPFLGGGEFQGPTHTTRSKMSPIWTSCPNSINDLRDPAYFRDSDYAGIFPSSFDWPASIAIISSPGTSAILTEGNHESATSNLGNSWLRVGSDVPETEYNNVTGFSWGRIRHGFESKFVISNVDGGSKVIGWSALSKFSSDYGAWVSEY